MVAAVQEHSSMANEESKNKKTTINQEKAQQSENHSAAQYSDNNC